MTNDELSKAFSTVLYYLRAWGYPNQKLDEIARLYFEKRLKDKGDAYER